MTRYPVDLLATVAVAGLAVAAALLAPAWLAVRVAAGGLLVLAAPGYALTSALFPLPAQLRWSERLLVSMGLSVTAAILGGVVLNFLPVGLSLGSWSVWLLGVTLAASAAAVWRRQQLGTLAPPVLPRLVSFWPALALTGALALAGGAVWRASQPAPAQAVQGYTLLWLLPDQGGAAGAAQLGVKSQEFTPTDFHLEVLVDGQVWRTWPAFELATGQTWEARLDLPAAAGQVEARLYREDQAGVPYRQVTLKSSP